MEMSPEMAEIIRRIDEFDSVAYAAEKKTLDLLIGNMEYKDIKNMKMSRFMELCRKAKKESERRTATDFTVKMLSENILKATPVHVRRMW